MTRPLRALLVEDSEDDALLVQLELERAGFAVSYRRVQTREQLEAALAENGFDIILSDWALRRLNATEALRIARESGLDLPFIIVSGTAGEDLAVGALKAGAHDFLLKDSLTRLVPAVTRELREAKLRREHGEALGRLRAAMMARDEFLAIASHELKTPITALELQLTSSVELVRSKPREELPLEKVVSKLEACSRQVERLTLLINNLIDVTTVTSGQLTITRRELELGEVVQGVLARMGDRIRRTGSELRLSFEPELFGRWDRIGLETVVTNLLSNAAKFGQGKPIELAVYREGEAAVLRVQDHGIGIAPDEQRRIFERFERAVPTEHYGGLGIGLWIARQIIQAHGGDIEVESVQGEGSTFTVRFPLHPPD